MRNETTLSHMSARTVRRSSASERRRTHKHTRGYRIRMHLRVQDLDVWCSRTMVNLRACTREDSRRIRRETQCVLVLAKIAAVAGLVLKQQQLGAF